MGTHAKPPLSVGPSYSALSQSGDNTMESDIEIEASIIADLYGPRSRIATIDIAKTEFPFGCSLAVAFQKVAKDLAQIHKVSIVG